jgi:hypothetical protein
MVRRPVDNLVLIRWRAEDAAQLLIRLADHAKPDASFLPISSLHTTRWHARFGAREYELLCTGPKFFDASANKGGGGAVDPALGHWQGPRPQQSDLPAVSAGAGLSIRA